MRAILADDEPLLRDELFRMLGKLWPELEIIQQCENGIEALEAIKQFKPDIAFLDIQMPGLDGLEVASQVPKGTYIVFITSYDNYAVEAFEKSAVDYLLKPLKEERLVKTIKKINNQANLQRELDMDKLVHEIRASISGQKQQPLKWVKALKGDLVHMIHINDIVYFHSDQKYTSAHTLEGEYIIRTPLNKLEEMLDSASFWRIHRGTIVNVNFIKSAKRTRDGRYLLKLKQLDEQLDVSRAYAHLFKQL